MARKKTPPPDDAGPGALAAALAGLGLQASTPSAPAASPAAGLPASIPGGRSLEEALAATPRVLLRRERKGRGGRTVTVLEGAPADQLEALAAALKKALGCGAGVEGATVVLQGEQGPAAARWLIPRGVKKVVQGN